VNFFGNDHAAIFYKVTKYFEILNESQFYFSTDLLGVSPWPALSQPKGVGLSALAFFISISLQ